MGNCPEKRTRIYTDEVDLHGYTAKTAVFLSFVARDRAWGTALKKKDPERG